MTSKISEEISSKTEGCQSRKVEKPCTCVSTRDPFSEADHVGTKPRCCDADPAQTTDGSALDRPGDALCGFVDRFLQTPAGAVPVIRTSVHGRDRWGAVCARLGIGRDRYKIEPGLYGTGNPGPESPVLVTANYKLTFDALRQQLANVDAWILVLNTKGVNVWCAAGKGTFSAAEVIRRVQSAGLDRLVNHRRLILPQLAAPGVEARKVYKECGFEVIWGPVQASDLKLFLLEGMNAEPSMRRVKFPLKDRLVLIPVEIALIGKPALWVLVAVFLLSGIGPDLFSFRAAWHRGLILSFSAVLGVIAGAVVTPALLPWIPGRAFAFKGMITGLGLGILTAILFAPGMSRLSSAAIILVSGAFGSYMAMNFTGSTPFTSPSGVEKEMRLAMPLQALAILIGAVFWVAARFAVDSF